MGGWMTEWSRRKCRVAGYWTGRMLDGKEKNAGWLSNERVDIWVVRKEMQGGWVLTWWMAGWSGKKRRVDGY